MSNELTNVTVTDQLLASMMWHIKACEESIDKNENNCARLWLREIEAELHTLIGYHPERLAELYGKKPDREKLETLYRETERHRQSLTKQRRLKMSNEKEWSIPTPKEPVVVEPLAFSQLVRKVAELEVKVGHLIEKQEETQNEKLS